jgi:uncharacterized protein (DUF427 family)
MPIPSTAKGVLLALGWQWVIRHKPKRNNLALRLENGCGAMTNLKKGQPMKAIWNGIVIAESADTVLVDGNHYFPASSLNRDYVHFSNHKTSCHWKGEASYYSLMVNGDMNTDAVWYYAEPKPEAAQIRDRVAFWKGVQVTA